MAENEGQQKQSGDSASDAPSPSEEFKQEQAAQAKQQNLSEEAVPEQRPQSFQTPRPEDTESKTALALREAGDPAVTGGGDKMTKSAYDKANSKAQREKAEKESRYPGIREGAKVRLKDIGDGWDGRNAVVIEVKYDLENLKLRQAGVDESQFAVPEELIVRTRDGRTDWKNVKPEQVEIVPDADWGRSGI